MPEVDEEKKQPDASSGTVYAQATPQQEQEFTPWSRIQGANKEVSDREAGELTTQVQGDVDKAKAGLESGKKGFNAGIDSNYWSPTPEKTRTMSPGALKALEPKPDTNQKLDMGAATNAPVDPNAPPPLQPGPQQFNPQGPATGRDTLTSTGQGPVTDRDAATATTQPAEQQTSNPWASFLDGGTTEQASQAAPAPAAPPAARTASPLNGNQPALKSAPTKGAVDALRPFGLSDAAIGGKPAGSKNLAESMGSDAWAQLLGDTREATDEAAALGNEGGIQALLERNNGALPDGGMDAALIGGAGGKGFRDMAKEYGGDALSKGVVDAYGDSQGRWEQLQGDIAKRQPGQAPLESIGGRDLGEKAGITEDAGAPDYTQGDMADDHALMNDILFAGQGLSGEGNAWSNMHAMGMTLNPADWAMIAMGEAGIDVPVTTEIFSKNFDMSGGEVQKTWPQGRFIMAFNELVNRGVSPQSRHAFLNFLKQNPAILQQYLAMKNPGFMARNMRQWMTSWDQANPQAAPVPGVNQNGYTQDQQGPVTSGTSGRTGSTQTAGYTAGNAEYGTTAEEETARTNAYRDGWGQDYDAQFRGGNRTPARGADTERRA